MSSPSAGVDLVCHAPARPSAIVSRKGKACGAILQRSAPSAQYEFVTTAARMPSTADGNTWIRCATCKTWNSFKVAPLVVLIGTPVASSIEQQLAQLPERQQIAVIHLAQGFSDAQTGRILGVDRKSVGTWSKRPDFVAVRDALAAAYRRDTEDLTREQRRAAMTALMDVIERDRARGVAHNARWFLSRTVFRDLELMKAQAGASGTNVSVSVAQSQSQTQGSITEIWERRRASVDAVTAVADPK